MTVVSRGLQVHRREQESQQHGETPSTTFSASVTVLRAHSDLAAIAGAWEADLTFWG
jgi:hypothetical protein